MLLQNSGTLLKLSTREQLTYLQVDRNQCAGIVMAPVHQHHADTQFAKHVLVKRIQPLVAVEADQQAVKMKVVTDSVGPVPVVRG